MRCECLELRFPQVMIQHRVRTVARVQLISAMACALAFTAAAAQTEAAPADPYPSTYRPGNGSFAIVGAMVLTGEGQEIANATVIVRNGRVAAVGAEVKLPPGVIAIDGRGKWVTPGIIDVHSHMGGLSTPVVAATESPANEVSAPITSEAWVEHSIRTDDPSFARAREAGVTIVQVLPGSANLFGGRSVVLKNVASATVEGMKMPGAPQGLKMACGENPARIYGSMNRAPQTPMESVAMMRSAFLRAIEYQRKWTAYREVTAAGKKADEPVRDLQLDTLVGALDGEIRVNIHCYRADQMAQLINLSHEFGFKISIFHHAVEAYRIADLLVREGIGVAGFVYPSGGGGGKLETHGTIPENGAFVTRAGGLFTVHSDYHLILPNLSSDAGRLMALSNRMGWPVSRADAIRWLTLNPATLLGIDKETGSLAVGKAADIVLWNRDPLSIYGLPEQVFIDGAKVFDRALPMPADSDFGLGIYRRS